MLERRVAGTVPRRSITSRCAKAASCATRSASRATASTGPTRSSITAGGRTRRSRWRWRTAGRRRRRRPTRRRARCASGTIGRRSSTRRSARRSMRACRCSTIATSRSASSRRRPTIRPTSPTATATICITYTKAAAFCARCSATWRSPPATTCSCRVASYTASCSTAPSSTGCRSSARAASGRSSSFATTSVSCAWTRRTRTATSRRPSFVGPSDEGIRTVAVKRGGAFHGFEWSSSPLDVVGWDGTVYPWAFPILNFQPRVSTVHLPPTWHGTFATRGALICSFVPRLVDFGPGLDPVPVSARLGRLRRVPLLRARQLHVAQGRGAGQHLAPSGRDPARAASGRLREQHRRQVDRRAGRHARHLPAAVTDGGGARRRGSRVPRQLLVDQTGRARRPTRPPRLGPSATNGSGEQPLCAATSSRPARRMIATSSVML